MLYVIHMENGFNYKYAEATYELPIHKWTAMQQADHYHVLPHRDLKGAVQTTAVVPIAYVKHSKPRQVL